MESIEHHSTPMHDDIAGIFSCFYDLVKIIEAMATDQCQQKCQNSE